MLLFLVTNERLIWFTIEFSNIDGPIHCVAKLKLVLKDWLALMF